MTFLKSLFAKDDMPIHIIGTPLTGGDPVKPQGKVTLPSRAFHNADMSRAEYYGTDLRETFRIARARLNGGAA